MGSLISTTGQFKSGKENPKKRETIFILCDTCFWCAICDQSFSFDHDQKHGVKLKFESIKKINLLLFNRSRERAIILPTSPFWYALLLIILFHKLNLCFIYEVIIVFRIHNYFFIITVENKIIYYNEYY